jgi:hypothetical protein
METHTEGRDIGTNGEFPKTGWPTNGTFETAPRTRFTVLAVMAALGRQLKFLTGVGSPPAKKAWYPPTPAHPSSSVTPEAMIKPSMHQRVAVENHRGDWP